MGKRILLKSLYFTPRVMRQRLYNVYDYIHYPLRREHKCCFGDENKDKIFYVIRPYSDTNEGLMSLLMNVCKQIKYAEKYNYIPMVDFKHYYTQYSDCGKNDAWSDYFCQISPYRLDEVYHSNQVVMSGLQPLRKPLFEADRRFSYEDMYEAKRIVHEYIAVNPEVRRRFDELRASVKPERSLGVYLRGTDYNTVKPVGHFVQPTVEEAIPYINRVLENRRQDNIFLVTEDAEIYNKMVREYGDRIVVPAFDSFISGYKEESFLYKSEKINEIATGSYERGLNYLLKIMLLSRCDSLVAGNTCGSWATVAFSKGFRHMTIIQNKRY